MKKLNIQFTLILFFLLVGNIVSAQDQTLQIYKNGNIVDVIKVSQIDSIKFGTVVLLTPVNVSAVLNDTNISISWDIVPKATSYEVFRSGDNVNYTLLQSEITTLTYTDNTPLSGKNYYKIKAVSTTVCSLLSAATFAVFIAPEIYFSRDKEGLDRIQPHYRYVEEATMENIYAQISSEEDLKYVVFYQSVGNQTTRINDTVFFAPGVKQAAVNVSYWDNGEEYVFAKGTTALKAMVTAGELKKMRETSLAIDYKYLVDFRLDQSADYFNGLPLNGIATLSGTITAENGLQMFTYTLKSRTGSVLQANVPILVNPDGTFITTFTAVNDLGSIVLNAEDYLGKTNEQTYDVHVGYKYYYLLAGYPGRGTNSTDGTPGPFISAQFGKAYSYCTAKNQSQYIDGGFELWSNENEIRFNRIGNFTSKLNSANITCRTSTWSTQTEYTIGESPITVADFDKATISQIMAQTVVPNYSNPNGFGILTGMTTGNPTPMKVAVYDTIVDGVVKRVLLVIDKMEDYVYPTSATTLQKTTFWIKMKVQL